MQYYQLNKKSLKQSLANVKTFLKEKDIHLPAGLAEEIVAKTLFQKNWNDAVANCNALPKKAINQRLVTVLLREPQTAEQFKKNIQTLAKKANYDFSCVQELSVVSASEYNFLLNKLKSDKNEITFLFLLWEKSWVKDLISEAFRVEFEQFGATDAAKKHKELLAEKKAENPEVVQFMTDIFGAEIMGKYWHENNPGMQFYINQTEYFLKKAWKLKDMPYMKRADWVLELVNKAKAYCASNRGGEAHWAEVYGKQDLNEAERDMLVFLDQFKSRAYYGGDSFNSIMGGFIGRLALKTQKMTLFKYSHPDADGFIVLEPSATADLDALNILLGDDAKSTDLNSLFKQKISMSLFEYENMPEFNG